MLLYGWVYGFVGVEGCVPKWQDMCRKRLRTCGISAFNILNIIQISNSDWNLFKVLCSYCITNTLLGILHDSCWDLVPIVVHTTQVSRCSRTILTASFNQSKCKDRWGPRNPSTEQYSLDLGDSENWICFLILSRPKFTLQQPSYPAILVLKLGRESTCI